MLLSVGVAGNPSQYPETRISQLTGGTLSQNISLPCFPVRRMRIRNNNKLAQSEAVTESLFSADISGIPLSELLCGYLIG